MIVPSFQRADRLPRLIAALEAQTLPVEAWELVIVDDCSTDDTPALLPKLAATTSIRLRSERTERNRGPAGARNRGWRSTTASLLAFTDDDCVPEPGWLAAGVRALEGGVDIGIVQGRTTCEPPADPSDYLTVIREVLGPSPWFEGCNLFIRRDALDAAGGFDEGIGWFGEETSLGWSILSAGHRRGWAPDAVVRHDAEVRSLRWHLRNRYLEGNLVRVAALHPELREAWWRPWAVKRKGAFFALAVAGLVASLRLRPAALLAVPYAASLSQLWRGGQGPAAALFQVAGDACSLAGKLRAAVRERIVVL